MYQLQVKLVVGFVKVKETDLIAITKLLMFENANSRCDSLGDEYLDRQIMRAITEHVSHYCA